MKIRAVIFDLGGVLLRTQDQAPRQALAARLGMSTDQLYEAVFNSPSAIQATLGQVTAEEHWDAVLQELGLAPEALPALQADFWAGDFIDWELVDNLRSLRPEVKTALLSNAWSDLRQMLTEKWKFLDAFDVIVASAELGIAKPDPAIYRLTVEKLGVAPGEAVFVDDMPQNVEAACQAGLQGIQFRTQTQVLEALERLLDGNRPDTPDNC